MDAQDPKRIFEIQFLESILAKHKTYVEAMELLCGIYTQQGFIDEGLKLDYKLVKLRPQHPDAHYNLACSLALKGDLKKSLQSLEKAVSLGYTDFQWLMGDPDLSNLQDWPGFKDFIKKIKANLQDEVCE